MENRRLPDDGQSVPAAQPGEAVEASLGEEDVARLEYRGAGRQGLGAAPPGEGDDHQAGDVDEARSGDGAARQQGIGRDLEGEDALLKAVCGAQVAVVSRVAGRIGLRQECRPAGRQKRAGQGPGPEIGEIEDAERHRALGHAQSRFGAVPNRVCRPPRRCEAGA